jgi:heat shock transcription factor, other eukaryote
MLMRASLVNDPETDEFVRWNDAGTSFIIPNSQLMAENVLPRSFKTINFASFVRQLNSMFPPQRF